MSVEINTPYTNVYDLSIFEREVINLIFDPERDIPKSLWLNIEQMTMYGAVLGKAYVARNIKIVAPKRLAEFKITEPRAEVFLKDDIDRSYITSDSRRRLAAYNIVFPGLIERLISDHQINFGLPRLNAPKDFFLAVEIAWEVIGLHHEAINTLRKSASWMETLGEFLDSKNLRMRALSGALVKLLAPATLEDADFGVDFWQLAKELLVNSSARAGGLFDQAQIDLQFARDLTILAAHRAEVTDRGLVIELYPPADNTGSIPNVPLERSFR